MNDRLAIRERPPGTPVMHQSWDKLLFLHWEVPVEVLRPLIPASLAIDTHDGKAWMSVTPLHIFDLRPTFIPALPYVSWLHELNVRTYVHVDGVPGVWFFSLDANSILAVLGARTFFRLPYYSADITLDSSGETVDFRSSRSRTNAEFAVSWTVGAPLPRAEAGSLDFFLVERYCLYAADGETIYRCRIHHEPWPLQQPLDISIDRSTVLEANGIPEPTSEPFAHCGGPVHVDVWPLVKVR
jgi:uncharacterized protein YqjF (DUF2071 family)